VNVRVIVATHKNLRELCVKGGFRWDLYYRLHVAVLKLPPLRYWLTTDKKGLIQFMFTYVASRLGIPKVDVASDALHAMMVYAWPGNIRELENFVQMITVYHSSQRLSSQQIHYYLPDVEEGGMQDMSLKSAIARHIKTVHSNFKGSNQALADLLGISLNTLKQHLKQINQDTDGK
jgi:DNA-binding NtrC family response regulator